MEHITSRKNQIILQLKALGTDSAFRAQRGEFLLDGEKLLEEALSQGMEISTVLWGGEPTRALPDSICQFSCPADIMQSVSPLKNSRGPVFSLKTRDIAFKKPLRSAIILENVQDPGNVGTVIRTANALGCDLVILAGDCAELFSPKTARATMGAIFRQPVIKMTLEQLSMFVKAQGLRLFGAALSPGAADIRSVPTKGLAVAIGSEGQGLSNELLALCEGSLIIPMAPDSESLNAAVAAAIVMWEMCRNS
ncbi:MAG: RNA methyltransferase [Oscillospiraceae bacterium]